MFSIYFSFVQFFLLVEVQSDDNHAALQSHTPMPAPDLDLEEYEHTGTSIIRGAVFRKGSSKDTSHITLLFRLKEVDLLSKDKKAPRTRLQKGPQKSLNALKYVKNLSQRNTLDLMILNAQMMLNGALMFYNSLLKEDSA